MPSERWLPAPGLEGRYEVSDLGAVRNAKTHRNRKLQLDAAGYFCFSAYDAGKITTPRVHRLVCAAFNGPKPTPDHVAAHNDGNQRNNSAGNLRWATAVENMADCRAHGTCWGRGSAIDEATARGIVGRLREGRPHTRIAREFGVSRHLVYNIKRGASWRNLQPLLS
jgi:hypothetical protein